MSYVELLCKSNFSFLTGASHPEELVAAAHAQGLAGFALNDRNGLYGVAKAYKHTRDLAGFKYIVGAELNFADHPEVTLLAQNRKGYGTLCRLLTHSHDGKEKGQARLSLPEMETLLQDLSAEGLICLFRAKDSVQVPFWQNLFGRNCYAALTRYLDGLDQKRTELTEHWARRFDLQTVASNDVYYHEKSRKQIQDILIAIREGKPLSEVGQKLFSNGERYFKAPQQMRKLFADRPETLERSLEIGEQCLFSLKELRYQYPSEWIPQGHDAQSYLEFLIQELWPKRYPGRMPEPVRKVLEHELSLIRQLGYADYFLTIHEIVDFAKQKGILCQGRGSAANSVVCYILGITAIDPVEMNLLFERFISVERNEPPDIDVDFEHERREDVIQHIYDKYGRDRAGMVSAVITYRFRSALREVSKAFGVDVGTLSAKKVERDFDNLTAHFPDPEKQRERIYAVTEILRGFPRHVSIHSGGFTLSATALNEIVPIEPARMEGRTIVQWDKYDLDILGLLKVDVLSLGMLSALRKALQLVGRELYQIPANDTATYDMICERKTVGTFQIESRAQMQMLGRLQPRNFYDLVVEVALVRPGPIIGNMVHPYLKRRRGLEKIEYPNEKVREILGKTLGVPLFQEQVMKLAIELAHFSPGEADQLRRSINAWRSSEPLSEMGQRLMRGLVAHGMSQQFADQIFQQIQGFSEYGFPESHAASFAFLAYVSCFLKKHHPAEFACSLINSQPLGFYRNDTILNEALLNGVQVRPVCIHRSRWDCTIEDPGVIRLGFRVIKGLAEADVKILIAERERRPFRDLHDFLSRTSLRREVLSRLAMAGRFQDFSFAAREALWALLEYENLLTEKTPHQLNLFQQSAWDENLHTQHFSPLDGFEKIQNDYSAFSLSTHGHPMQELRRMLHHIPATTSRDLAEVQTGARVRIGGLLLIRQMPPTAKGVVFATLEDEFGFIDLVLHPKIYEKYREVFLQHCFLIASGVVQRDLKTLSLSVKSLSPIFTEENLERRPLHLEPDQYFYG